MATGKPWHCVLKATESKRKVALWVCFQTPTQCPVCTDKPQNCRHSGHEGKPIEPAGRARQVPDNAQLFGPEHMEASGGLVVKPQHYSPDALGAGCLGPVSIQHVIRFCRELAGAAATGRNLAVFCSDGTCVTANTMLLVASYLMFEEGLDASNAFQRLPAQPDCEQRFPTPWRRSISWHACSLTVRDCLDGLEAAVRHDWLDYKKFDDEEWRARLKEFDACAMLNVSIKNASGDHCKIHFYGAADPVTTVVDPTVRPSPPQEGFLDDYYAAVSSRKSAKQHTPSKAYNKVEDLQRDRAFTASTQATLGADSLRNSPKGIDEVDLDLLDEVASTTSLPGHTPTKPFPRPNFISENPALTSTASAPVSKRVTSTRSLKRSTSWIGKERVKRWAYGHLLTQSSVPSAIIKTRGFITMPEFGLWLRSVGCQSLLQLNYPNEPNLPPGGSYGSYFTKWGVRQDHVPFQDGTPPTKEVNTRLVELVRELMAEVEDNRQGNVRSNFAIVVHCTAGLGRTAAALGAIAHGVLDVPGSAFFGWARMCRPGSVQTQVQEVFLKHLEKSPEKKASCCLPGF